MIQYCGPSSSSLTPEKLTTVIEKLPDYIDLVSPMSIHEQNEESDRNQIALEETPLDLRKNRNVESVTDSTNERTNNKRKIKDQHASQKKMKRNPASLLAPPNKFVLDRKAISDTFTIYKCVLSSIFDIHTLVQVMLPEIVRLLTIELVFKKLLKFHFCLHILFEKDSEDGLFLKSDYISTKLTPLFQSDDINRLASEMLQGIEDRIDQYSQSGSGWRVAKIEVIELRIVKFRPLKGGCEGKPLPDKLRKKTRSYRTVKCSVDCFMYSVLAALHPTDHAYRPSRYAEFINNYDFSMVRGIVPLHNIKNFEVKNNISVNVYTFDDDDKVVIPLKVCVEEKPQHVNLCLYDDHYHAITNLSSFVRCKSHSHICTSCLYHFKDGVALIEHTEFCKKMDPQRVNMPTGDCLNVCRKNFKKESKFPFIIYGDFETLSIPGNVDAGELNQNEPCSFGLIVVNWKLEVIHSKFYRGPNPAQIFLKELINLTTFLDKYFTDNSFPNLNMTQSDVIAMQSAKHCHICLKPLKGVVVRDHDHLTGKFRGPAHQDCNVNYKVPKDFPVVFHNLKNFDGHIIINALQSKMFNNPPSIIAQSIEKYIGFKLDRFKFIDSLAFLPSSLDTLSSHLSVTKKTHFLQQAFPGDDVTLLLRKGALPYEYLNSHQRFEETQLPGIEKFYSSLTDSDISQSVYDNLNEIWSTFKCRNLGDFHDIYLKVDVYLLAAVFENFRQTSIDFFNIDPPHH